MIDNIRHPKETYEAYRSRMRVGRIELDRHLAGTPIMPRLSDGKKLLQVISKARGAKKKAMQALGITSGKRFRELLKLERRTNAENKKP